MATSTLELTPKQLGLVRGGANPPGTVEECNRLLQKNHETYHMFFREMAGMNHISHSLLTCLALGAGPQELRDRYADEAAGQRPMPPVDQDLLEKLDDAKVFLQTMHVKVQYNTFLHFFERKIATAGYRAVVQEYVFAGTEVAERMFSSMFDGLYHPLIHLGLGVEFDLPGIVAEALAQAAANDDSDLYKLFGMCEAQAAKQDNGDEKPQSLLQLVDEIRATEEIRTAPRWSDMGLKLRNGVVGRAGDSFARVAGKVRVAVDEDELRRRTAEMISTVAYMCGEAQFEGRKTKIDFFWMHSVTSSIFMSVLGRQNDWISLKDRARLLEFKMRTDLAWYACSGSPALVGDFIVNYSSPQSDGWSWEDVFGAVTKEHDDGHAAKFIRALKNGEQVCREYEDGHWAEYFPTKGDMWLKLARIAHDTTKNMPIDLKWVRFIGYDEAWQRPDLM
ncbi:hypothetical protein GGS20DRAFT_589481 [Poronia punctata]|nr:hypothetical protein GGS20DRAFT_589481 [Poronia punctata]